jgi:hypothetical protein
VLHRRCVEACSIETLIGAAEGRDFLMHARIGMLRALNMREKREPGMAPQLKRSKSYRIIR